MSKDELSRRAALMRIGALAGAAYSVPAITTMSAAFANSDSSASSGTSEPSEPSEPSEVSEVSVASDPSYPSLPSSATAEEIDAHCRSHTATEDEFAQCVADQNS